MLILYSWKNWHGINVVSSVVGFHTTKLNLSNTRVLFRIASTIVYHHILIHQLLKRVLFAYTVKYNNCQLFQPYSNYNYCVNENYTI